jgi:hypothetical protein
LCEVSNHHWTCWVPNQNITSTYVSSHERWWTQ